MAEPAADGSGAAAQARFRPSSAGSAVRSAGALLGDRPAGPAEGRESGAVIVGVPAGQIREGERLEPGVADGRRVGGGAPGGEGKKAQEEKG